MDAKNLASRFGLAPREAETLFYLASGKSNADIAGAMGVSEVTVKNVVKGLAFRVGLADERGGSVRVRLTLRAWNVGEYADSVKA